MTPPCIDLFLPLALLSNTLTLFPDFLSNTMDSPTILKMACQVTPGHAVSDSDLEEASRLFCENYGI